MKEHARTVAMVAALFAAAVAGPLAGAAAAAPPEPPASYYGQATVDGDPAPAGVSVSAVVDGSVVATIETNADGSFGGPGAFADKLDVSKPDAENATVTFRVAGEPTGVSANWSSGSATELSLSVSDDTSPSASIDAVSAANVGNTVTFDASATDNVGVTSLSWSFGDGASATGSSVSHAYSSPGTYTVTLTASDDAGNTVEATTTITVSPAPAPPEPPADDADEPTDTGNDTADEPANDTADEPSVNVTLSPDATNVSVSTVSANDTATVSFPETNATATESTTLTGMNVSTTENTSLNLSVSVSDDSAGDTPEPDAGDGGGEVVTYIQVDHDVPEESIGEVSFSFTVAESTLAERGVAPENVVLYRYHDGAWNELETTHIGTTDGVATFGAVSPGLSVFAVRSGSASLNVTDAALDTTTVAAGESATVSVTVENDGTAAGNTTVELTLDGDQVSTQTVSLDAGESTTARFTVTPDAGTYEVAANGVTAGTLTVESETTTTTQSTGTTQSTTTVPPAEQSQLDTTALVVFGGVAMLVVALFAVARRRQ
ncbi:PKD domain-containing protein [Salarchaeum japonicum]|uniref:PKD domain-containing protein n=1 Tax=Salarchaeum japonicum TaxID=555573 RepID=UPI003C7087C8